MIFPGTICLFRGRWHPVPAGTRFVTFVRFKQAHERERPSDLSARALAARQSTFAVDRDAPDVVLLDALQRYPPFEPAIIPLTEATILVFRLRFLFAGDR